MPRRHLYRLTAGGVASATQALAQGTAAVRTADGGYGHAAAGRAGRGGARGAMSWLGRAIARLLPAGRRDWAEAAWAEAQEVPPGWPRLAWRAGGVRLIAREAHMVRGAGTLLLFTAAAGAAAWSAWPGSAVGHAATARADIIGAVALLAGLPLLSRWLLGGPGNRAARWLRAGCYAAILAIYAGQGRHRAVHGHGAARGPGPAHLSRL